jgi:hypothetical protein
MFNYVRIDALISMYKSNFVETFITNFVDPIYYVCIDAPKLAYFRCYSWLWYFLAVAKSILIWGQSSTKNLQATIYLMYRGAAEIRKYLIASSNIDDTMEFIKNSRSWTKVSFGDEYWHHFVVLATYPVVDTRYRENSLTVLAVTNFDADIIINHALKQNVDIVVTDKDPELQGKLKKLGIEFTDIAFVTDDDKMLREIHNLTVLFPTYDYAPQLGYSDQGLATQQDSPWYNDDCSWTMVEIDKRLPLPMFICSNTVGNKVKMITDRYGSSIAINDDNTHNFVAITHQVVMGIPLHKIPQVRMHIKGVDINGIEPIDFAEGGHPHILVITIEGGGRTDDACITDNVCVRHSKEKSHLIAKGKTRDDAIASFAKVPLGKEEIPRLAMP